MEFRIETYPAFTAVGMKVRYKMGSHEGGNPKIEQLWDRFVPKMGAVPNAAPQHTSYGVMGNYDHATQEFDYMACVAVTTVGDLPEGMEAWSVPEQTYAVFTTPLKTIGKAFAEIYQTALPASDYVRGDGPEFELYDENFKPDQGKTDLSIWIPVKPR